MLSCRFRVILSIQESMTTTYCNCKMDETSTGNSGNYLDVFASSNFLKENIMKFVNFFFPISLRALFIVFFFAGFSLVQAENLKMSVMIEHDHHDSENMIKLVPKVIRVKQNDRVTLNIKTMQNGIMHIHGYDIENEVKKGELGNLHFEANATGRFKITFHAKEEHAHKKKKQKHGGHEAEGNHSEGTSDHATEHKEEASSDHGDHGDHGDHKEHEEEEQAIGYLEVYPN